MKMEMVDMDKEVLKYVTEKTHDLINSPSCCSEIKIAAQAWTDAVGTEQETAEMKKYIAELKADIMPINMLIAFAESDEGIQLFGANTAENIAAHAKKIQTGGAKYCDCPACTAASAILSRENAFL